MKFTPAQLDAIRETGNTLVIAGAGTGKTRTLVRRCVDRLLDGDHPVGLDEILVVTFTEAAAAEVRHRIRTALEEELDRRPGHPRLPAQLAALDTAHICTLHSFCLDLIRQHYHELHIDPQPGVLAEDQSALLADEILDDIFRRHYESDAPESESVRQFIQDQADGWDDRVKEMIGQIHDFTQTRPDPEGWFERQLAVAARPDPAAWRDAWLEGFESWKSAWLPVLELQAPENPVAQRIVDMLRSAPDHPSNSSASFNSPAASSASETLAALASRVRAVIAADAEPWPKSQKTRLRKPLEKFFKEAAFLESLARNPEDPSADPLAEDWRWVQPSLTALLRLAREFADAFSAAKRERGAVDFHDLEQFALKLLWDPGSRAPTDLARHWQDRLKLLFIDEYQDINEAQDTILTALSRGGAGANRFIVGDIKQSIYRFRQAAPRIFQAYAADWAAHPERGRTVWLSDNFRSREGLLRFVNPFFASVMRAEIGGVDYDTRTQLQFGNPEDRRPVGVEADPHPRVEVHLHLTGTSLADAGDGAEADADTDVADGFSSEPDVRRAASGPNSEERTVAETEARFVARRLAALREAGHRVWDTGLNAERAVDWKDMVVLLRAPNTRVETYAKEFAAAGVPLHAKRTGFYESPEVLDLIHMLNILDNPLQDIPAVAVLRSPLAGLSLEDLATLRPAAPKAPFWTALRRWHQIARPEAADGATPADDPTRDRLHAKVTAFLARYDHWRSNARHMPLAHRLEMVLSDTSYMDWLLTQPRGAQRQANVAQLLHLAREFDAMHAQGLHRFLRLIEAQKNAELDREPAPVDTENAVRLMSIHQSKGLEFPVVALPDLGKRFNLASTRGMLMLDDHHGLCLRVKPPGAGRRYPSLPLWLAQSQQRLEALGEEMRLLYVALTRAKDTLILAGTCAESALRDKWPARDGAAPTPHQLGLAANFLGWLGPWLAAQAGGEAWADQARGSAPFWTWQLHRPSDAGDPGAVGERDVFEHGGDADGGSVLAAAANARVQGHDGNGGDSDPERIAGLRERLTWVYPHSNAARIHAKSSVTALKETLAEETDEDARSLSFARPAGGAFRHRKVSKGGLDAAQIGVAHHRFLQWVDLDRTRTARDLRAEGDRLVDAKLMSEGERDALDWGNLERFWNADPGALFRQNPGQVRREWPFTARLSGQDLQSASLPSLQGVPDDDFVVVQGVVDLALLRDDEIWVVDFKTDRVNGAALEDRIRDYAPQLGLYALALTAIHGKPVTRRWLHFLPANHTAPLPTAPSH